jgi:CBS domain-containing protein
MKARELMVRDTVTASPQDDLQTAAEKMRHADCGILPVVNRSREVVGLLTDRDVCIAAADAEKPLREIFVHSVMNTGVRAVSTRADVEDIHDLMREYAVRRVPVLDDDHRLVGIVSIDDLAARALEGDEVQAAAMSRMVTETLAALAARHAAKVIRGL